MLNYWLIADSKAPATSNQPCSVEGTRATANLRFGPSAKRPVYHTRPPLPTKRSGRLVGEHCAAGKAERAFCLEYGVTHIGFSSTTLGRNTFAWWLVPRRCSRLENKKPRQKTRRVGKKKKP